MKYFNPENMQYRTIIFYRCPGFISDILYVFSSGFKINRNYVILSFLWLVAILVVYIFSHQLQAVNNDTPVEIVFTGDWKGDFLPNNNRGGMASLHSLIRESKKQRQAENGNLLFFFSGNMTGAKSSGEYLKKMIYPQLRLADYLGIDAILADPNEITLIQDIDARDFNRFFYGLPIVQFNYRNLRKDRRIIHPFKLMKVSKVNVMVTAIGNGEEPGVDTNPVKRMFLELNRQTGVDLLVILMSRNHKMKKDDESNSGFFSESREEFSAVNLLQQKEFYKYFIPKISQKTRFVGHEKSPAFVYKTIILISGARQNRFYRHHAGPYICEIKPKQMCRLSLTMRNRILTGLDQDFVDINSDTSKHSWIIPDRLLYEALDLN